LRTAAELTHAISREFEAAAADIQKDDATD
jgi:hypothetical protein